jgi:hypothetical protein
MPDAICDQDADLIAKALASGKVTRIPQGKSAYELPTWGNNRLTDPVSLHWRKVGRRGCVKAGLTPDVAERRVRVREARLAGESSAAIAKRERVSHKVISKDICAMREQGFQV